MKTRIITGLALAVVALVLVGWSPTWLFSALTLVMLAAVLPEWCRLMENPITLQRIALCIVVIVLLAALLYQIPQVFSLICAIGALFWLFQAFNLLRNAPPKPAGVLEGTGILLVAWSALVWVHSQGIPLIIAMLLLVWGADTFAYFGGKYFGKHPLAPSISPGKTIEGLLSSFIGVGVIAMLAMLWIAELQALSWRWWVVIFATILFSVVGDLYESRLKRRAGVKDSGNLLPGHGGLFDRLDGLLAAAPVFAVLGWWAT